MQIELVNDTVFEGPEQFLTLLFTVELVVIVTPDTARILIQDDDGEWGLWLRCIGGVHCLGGVRCVGELCAFIAIVRFNLQICVLVIVIWKEEQVFGQLTICLKTKFVSL